jgi:cytochrome c553
MMKRRLFSLLILALALSLAACGGGDDTAEPAASNAGGGDAARGDELYHQTTIGAASAPGCVTCHSQEEGVTLVGPSHAGLASRSDVDEAFLRQSIMEPDAVVTEGFTAGVMYQNYATDLSDQQIDDLVAYLLTLK